MKIVTKTNPYTAFEYRGTEESRERLREMEFCKEVLEELDCIWVTDRGDDQYLVESGDWIIVGGRLVIDVLNEATFADWYTVVGEAS